jgi:uncharacterized protein YukE
VTAAAELGQSEDPKALVPGNPEAIEGHARALVAHSEHFDTVAQDLGKVDVPGWTGVASSAFLDTFSKEPPKWTKVCDALTSAGSAVSGYAGTLSWAQSQADEAIALWKQGEAATKQATSAHNQAVANADAQNKAAVAEGTSATAQVAPFSDPGEALRKQAREMLDRARKQLKEAGDTAATAISGAPAEGTTASSAGGGALDNLVNAVTGGMKVAGKAQASGPKAGFEMSGPKDGKLGELKAYAELAKASAEGSISNQFLTVKGKAEAGIGAEATAAASFTNEGLKAKVEASAGAKASAEYRVDAGPLGYGAKAEGFAGAQAGAGLTAGKDGLEAKAEAFAGAKGSVRGQADIGGIGAGATAEGWAGAGAEASATFGKGEDGKFHIGASAGAAVGVGGKVGFDLAIDPNKVADTAKQAGHAVGEGVSAVGKDVENVGKGIENVGKGISHLF